MELAGTVLNVVDFGAFVDIGLHDTGLVHISQLANKYVRDPHDVVSVGDIVKVWVLEIDKTRRRVSLTMIAPGTERTQPPKRGEKRKRDGTPRRGPAPGARRKPAPPKARRASARRVKQWPRPRRRSPIARRDRPIARPGLRAGRSARDMRRTQHAAQVSKPNIERTSAARTQTQAAGSLDQRDENRQGALANLRRFETILRAEAGSAGQGRPKSASD